ncbi:hypothetical protein ACFFQW_44870 [Umezawaea endophytica]|uniref:Uncharacterized protein n=1 Tax=Umezawaea endophytica TaxID=1654476 RepID=A0A9X2VS78_9PSEU|nr:hypothetical protein [Umezawaea endophytica]MCS7481930.1 hypothetical protein [Umezawaea endophytica]
MITTSPPARALEPRVHWHRPLIALSAAMVAVVLVSAIGLLVDDRLINGSPAWSKPLKFGISFALFGATLAWMLTLSRRARRTGWWAGTVVAVISIAEMALVLTQVVRGKTSHFNTETEFDDTLFNLMGQMILILWIATFVVSVVVSLQRQQEPATTWAIRFGLGLSLIGMLLAFFMTDATPEQRAELNANRPVTAIGAHSVGVPDGGPSMPVTGWSTTGGDLRIPHFVGIHALQALPLLSLLLVALAAKHPLLAKASTRLHLTLIATAGYTATIALLTWQALRGQALLHPDTTTLTAAGTLIAVLAIATTAVLSRSARSGRPAPPTC